MNAGAVLARPARLEEQLEQVEQLMRELSARLRHQRS
ncbi:MAG: hypothetical protein QOH31_4422 [Verrucomicrobiota bacterium]|jgi:hypothetical protein